jgi:hypothetical protein
MGMESAYLPLVMGGLGAMQGAFSGGDDEPFMLEPYGGQPGAFLDPRRMLTQNVRDVAHLGGIMAGRAAQPVAFPSAFVQPTQWYGGGGLPFPMGRTAMDPALFAPDYYQQRPGAKFAQPSFVKGAEDFGDVGPVDSHRWMFGADIGGADAVNFEGGYAPRETGGVYDVTGQGDPKLAVEAQRQVLRGTPAGWAGLDQGPTTPAAGVGGGIPQLMANLELLGVTTDPNTGGLINQGPEEIGNLALFTGGGNVRRRFPAGPEPGTGLDQPQWQQPDVGAPLTIPKLQTKRRNPGTFGWGSSFLPQGPQPIKT